jgi:hypothetical protein
VEEHLVQLRLLDLLLRLGDRHLVVRRQHGLIIVSCTRSSSTPPTSGSA